MSGWPSIKGREVVPVKRTMLLDLSSLTNDDGSVLALDNIEGIPFGPTVHGKRTLILVSDNNFNPAQFTQFIVHPRAVEEEPQKTNCNDKHSHDCGNTSERIVSCN